MKVAERPVFFLALFASVICIPVFLHADIHVSTSCDQGAVQAAVDAASDGDTVEVPAGTGTWVSNPRNKPSIKIENKNITLKGAGIGQTIIRDYTDVNSWSSGPEIPIWVTGGTGKPFRITGFTFDGTGRTINEAGTGIQANGEYMDFRIDHCRFLNIYAAIYLPPGGLKYGVIDNNTYEFLEVKGQINPKLVSCSGDGEPAWQRPLAFGTSNSLFIEDNYIYFSTASGDNCFFASGNGARVVYRYNYGENGFIEPFGVCVPDYAGNIRGTSICEIYENTIFGKQFASIELKGGAGVIYNNTINGSFTIPWFDNYRTCSHSCDAYFGRCDGLSCIDGNLAIDSGTHTGSSNQLTTLTCAGKSWTANQWVNYAVWNITDYSVGLIVSNTANTITVSSMTEGYGFKDTGTATSAGTNILTCAGRSWSTNYWKSRYIWNVTDNSWGRVTASNSTTITAVLTGGTSNNWKIGDTFMATLCVPRPGIEKDFDNGDVFKITNGYPCLDQIGRATDASSTEIQPQKAEPVYGWGNTYNGSTCNLQPRFFTPCASGGASNADQMLEGRDYYNYTKPGYTPYTYPHPLTLEGLVDTSSPTAPATVYDGSGTGVDVTCTFSTTSLAANWTPGGDSDSGIAGYRFAVGTTAGGTNTLGWSSVGGTSTTTPLNVALGTTYYFTVKSVNGVGLVSETAANSNGQYVTTDGTPPSAPGVVRDGTLSVDISTTISTTQLSANWTAGADAESGISGYQYAIGTTAGASDTYNWTTLGVVTTVTRPGLALSVGATYYFSVKSINGAGLYSTASNSNGVVVVSTADVTAPVMGAVRDGTGTDIGYTQTNNTLSANWTAATDPESGITIYQYAIGTMAGGTNTAGWTTLGFNYLSVTRSTLTLTTGTTYYFSVKATNGNNMVSAAVNSNGQYVIAIDTGDTTPPTAPAVIRDGTGSDVDSSTDLTQLSANWDASIDAESAIARYWYAIGTQPSGPGASNTQGWTNNGQATAISVSITLAVNTTYYVSVKAENNVGFQSSTTTSNGLVVLPPPPLDTSSPSVSGVAAQNITATGATIVWTTDEGATTLVEYGRTTNYDRQTIEDPAYVTGHSATLTGLIENSVYHYRVISRDASGNTTTSVDYIFTTSAPAQPIGENIHAYPNPCKVSAANPVRFRASGSNISEVSIYTVSGRLIRKLSGTAAEVTWDGKNADGQKVGRGIYVYKITTTAGDTVTGKIALTR